MKSHQNPELLVMMPADLMKVLIHIRTYSGARNRYNLIKDSIGKKKHQRITIKEFADYEGLPPLEVLKVLHN